MKTLKPSKDYIEHLKKLPIKAKKQPKYKQWFTKDLK